MNVELPTTLRPSRLKATLLFLVCLLFVIIGVLMVRKGNPVGYFCCGVFALGLPVFALQFHPRAAYLRLEPEGFTFCSLFRSHTVRWKDVGEFAVITVGQNQMIAWNYTPDYSATGRAGAISKSFFGYEAAMSDTYGMKPQALVDLLESIRQRNVGTWNA